MARFLVCFLAVQLFGFCQLGNGAALTTGLSSASFDNDDNGSVFSTGTFFHLFLQYAVYSDNAQQRLRGKQQQGNNLLPGVQRLPQPFQGFLASNNNFNSPSSNFNSLSSNFNGGGGMGGVGSLTNGLDLETFTKNQAIRVNQVCTAPSQATISNFAGECNRSPAEQHGPSAQEPTRCLKDT